MSFRDKSPPGSQRPPTSAAKDPFEHTFHDGSRRSSTPNAPGVVIRREYGALDRALGRFEITRRLGAGGMGVVYEAWDDQRGMTVAVKTLQHASPSAIYRLKREFRSLADMSHPNLISLYELFLDDERLFFSMELVAGEPLTRFLRQEVFASSHPSAVPTRAHAPAPTPSPDTQSQRENPPHSHGGDASKTDREAPLATAPPVGPARTGPMPALPAILQTFAQLTEGLRALHEAGMLHRDIKPSNVLVTEEGRVVVLDFGLVADRETHPDASRSVAGTPKYMPPEQWLGEPATPANDWYSVGVMLYEVLTGRAPFLGELNAMMSAKLQTAPRSPIEINPEVPRDLSDLCMELLDPEPSQRPTGEDVARRLGVRPRTEATPATRATPLPEDRAFVGREAELARLSRAFERTRRGTPVAVHVLGESGMGKTSLCEEFLDRIREPGTVVLRGRCYQQESLPFKALDAAVDELSRHLKRLSDERVAGVLPAGILDLTRVFPVLSQVRGVANARRRVLPSGDAVEARRRAFTALRSLLTRIAAETPLVLWIDDAHWGDRDSAAALYELIRPPHAPALMLMLSYWGDEAATSPFLRELLTLEADTSASAEVDHIEVGRLPPSDCKAMVHRLMTRETGPQSRYVERIVRETGGVPFFIEQLVRFVDGPQESPATDRQGGRTPPSEDREVMLADMLRSRIDELEPDARKLLDAVALAGRPIDSESARCAAQLESLDGTTLNLLRVSHLVRVLQLETHAELAPYHEQVRATAVREMDSESTRALHGRLATALESSSYAHPRTLATHFHAFGELHKAGTYAEVAAREAAAALAFDDAERLFGEALLWNPGDDGHRRALTRLRADALVNCGRCLAAAPLYASLVDDAPPADVTELRQLAAEQYFMGGEVARGGPLFRQAMGDLGLRMPSSARRAMLDMALDVTRLRLRGTEFRAAEESAIDPQVRARIEILFAGHRSLNYIHSIRATSLALRGLRLALAEGYAPGIAEGLVILGRMQVGMGRGARGQANVAKGLALAEGLGDPTVHGTAALWATFLDHFAGRWNVARDGWDHAARLLASRPGNESTMQAADVGAILVTQLMGEFSELSHRTDRALVRARETGNRYAEVTARLYSAVVYLAADDVDGARSRIQQSVDRAPAGDNYTAHSALKFQVFCDLYEGRPAKAVERLDASWPKLVASRLMSVAIFRVTFGALRAVCLARASALDGDPRGKLRKQARKHVLQLERDAKLPLAAGHAAWLRAALANLDGDRSGTLEHLGHAAEAFESGGMPLEPVIARWTAARLRGRDDDAGEIADTEAFMRRRGIANPARWTAAHAPLLPDN